MFYSHEILTSREGGLATVWLVATVGQRAHNKKLSRKAIQSVNVPNTCDRIINSEAPMALRLQSNLLYGVSRVFFQQSGYLLSDAQIAQSQMRALLKAVRTSELDLNAGKARPEQLVVQDDPDFAANLYLQGLDFDISALNMSASESSCRSSVLSKASPLSSQSSQHSGPMIMPALNLPSSAGSIGEMGGFQSASDYGSYVHRNERLERLLDEDEGGFAFDSPGFSIDAEGNLIEDQKQTSPHGDFSLKPTSESKANAFMRQDMSSAPGSQTGPAGLPMNDFDFFQNNDGNILPDAQPFPTAKDAKMVSNEDSTFSFRAGGEENASDRAHAPLRRRKPKPRALPFDQEVELRNSNLADWRDNYSEHMQAATIKLQHQRAPQAAKRNAAAWVNGSGIGNVGRPFGGSNDTNPLAMFSGDGLMQLLTGQEPLSGRKREHAELSGDDSDSEAQRRRLGEAEDQVGRGAAMLREDDMPLYADSEVEIGRHAETPLADDPTYPWNTTASAIASRQGSSVGRSIPPGGFSSSVGGIPSSIPKRPSATGGGLGAREGPASRLQSASPLTKRGDHRLSSLELPAGGGDDELDATGPMSDDQYQPFEGDPDSFEMHGPGAGIGTQVQAGSQWLEATLDREAHNFLDFLREEINKLAPDELEAVEGDEDELAALPHTKPGKKMVEFEQLLPPIEHTKIVASQALHHVLALATKNLVEVEQEEAFGTIKLGVLVDA